MNQTVTRSFVLATVLLSFSFFARSQSFSDCNASAFDGYIENEEILTGVFNSLPISGKHFINTNWRKGEVLLENGKKVTNVYLNYNLITGQLLWLRTTDYKQILLNRETIKQFAFYQQNENETITFRKIYFRPWYRTSSDYEYLQVLSEGSVNVYVFRKGHVNINNNEVERTNEYYYSYANDPGHLSNFILRRYSLYKIVGADKLVLRKIIRSNHFRIRKEYNMVKAMELYNKEKMGSY